MGKALKLDPQQCLRAYETAGSLRGAAKLLSQELGKTVGHMVVKTYLEEGNLEGVLKQPQVNPQSMSPRYKVYIRPEQFEALDEIAGKLKYEKGLTMNRHAVARHLLDKVLAQELGRPWEVQELAKPEGKAACKV